MKRAHIRNVPSSKRETVKGTVAGDKRKMREAWQERMKLEADFLKSATELMQAVKEAFK